MRVHIYHELPGLRLWAGSGPQDEYGHVECTADLPEEVYDAIEADDDHDGGEDGEYSWDWEVSR